MLCHYQARQYEVVKDFVKINGSIKSTLMKIVEDSDLPEELVFNFVFCFLSVLLPQKLTFKSKNFNQI